MGQSEQHRDVYEQLVRDNAAGLYRYAFRLCGRAETAEDLVQETFTEAWRGIGSLRDSAKGRAWLFQILRFRFAHFVRDARRRLQPIDHGDAIEFEPEQPGDDVLEAIANRELLQRALDALDETFKEPLLMVLLDGATCRETAEQLEIPLGTVLSRIHRGRAFLREFLRNIDRRDDPLPNRVSRELPAGPVSGPGGES